VLRHALLVSRLTLYNKRHKVEVMEAKSRSAESYPGEVETPIGGGEAHLGALETHLGTVERGSL
jgi:hypothetical protein